MIDSSLNWKKHVEYVSTKLARITYLMRNLRYIMPLSNLIQIYFSLFESHIRYGLFLWGNCTKIDIILKQQKAILRIFNNSNARESCRPLFKKYGVLTVINLYILDVILYVAKNVSVYNNRCNIHSYSTRNNCNLEVPFCRLTKTMNNFYILGQQLYNRLPFKLRVQPIKIIKEKLISWLQKNPFYDLKEFLGCNLVDEDFLLA